MNPVTAREREKGGGMSGMAGTLEVLKPKYVKEEAHASAASRGDDEDKGTKDGDQVDGKPWIKMEGNGSG